MRPTDRHPRPTPDAEHWATDAAADDFELEVSELFLDGDSRNA